MYFDAGNAASAAAWLSVKSFDTSVSLVAFNRAAILVAKCR